MFSQIPAKNMFFFSQTKIPAVSSLQLTKISDEVKPKEVTKKRQNDIWEFKLISP